MSGFSDMGDLNSQPSPVNSFYINRTFTVGAIGPLLVTNVDVTKVPQ
jgi:hypothetical protein